MLLGEGALVSAFGTAGLVSAVLHRHAGPTGTPILGLASTPAHSAILLALGVLAIAAAGNRRAAVTVTALSAVAYLLLLFFSSVATARTVPTPLGFHAADIVLHGLLGVVNFALLMWLIPDELGDEAWVRRRGRERDPRAGASGAVPGPGAALPGAASPANQGPPPAAAPARAQEIGDHESPSQRPAVRGQASRPGSTTTPVDVPGSGRTLLERPKRQEANEPSAHSIESSSQQSNRFVRATDALLSGGVVPVALAVLAAVVGVTVWIRRR
ncbi:DUF4383 domain-containing protein [Mycobacterium sp. E2733]|uniref:DUF4383 domain-containing protein n=1 Tax=Mycobacterium sp. E2733 TaxID=1834138 RepID=UPI000801CF39|nr:DUF4383 domain-containing protein [Mycobacterium sp. E2733]OBH89411.1 hypothetical protein A5678_14370 [Mycobacterium sp. E2733]